MDCAGEMRDKIQGLCVFGEGYEDLYFKEAEDHVYPNQSSDSFVTHPEYLWVEGGDLNPEDKTEGPGN